MDMGIHSLLTADEEYLKQLDSKKSVELFRDLIWAEAYRFGIPLSKVTISLLVTVPDGGVDAAIDIDDVTLPSGGLFEKGKNSYQIKVGGNFKPQNKTAIIEELFDKKTPSLDNLAPEVRSCLEGNGKYVIVCFGLDLTPAQRNKAKSNLIENLRACGFDAPNVDVWSINNIKGFVEQYPALSLQTNRFYNEPFWTHKEWANRTDMKVSFKAGKEQEEMLEGIRSQLRRNDSPAQLRILGEAGLGKTRLALEATNTDDIQPLVVYALAGDFDGSPVMTELIRNDALNAIVIIDECDSDQRARFWNNLKSYYPRIKLVSIYNESDTVTYDTTIYELTALESEQISGIIQGYGITKFEADRWIPECGGSPRVAHVVGENLRSNPEDILKSPSNINIWDRYICGKDRADSENARQRRSVLQHIALFKRFGYESPVKDEAAFIHKMIQETDPHITWIRFREIIKQLKEQRILQGKSTLYITPKLLHIKLWIDWWNLHGDSFDTNRITEFPSRLIEWFFEMFEYAEGSPSASQKAKELLGEKGIFYENRGKFLNERIGARFFFHLTLAEPVSALRCLQQTIGTWSKEELFSLDQTRGLIVSSLEHIALWDNLFQGAARILLVLGEAENQTYSNNASGVFAELFQLSEHKELSKSEAAPSQRIQVLQEALNSKSPDVRKLGLDACKRALSWTSGGFIRDTHRVTGKHPNLWYPKTYGELFDAYREIWKLLFSSLDSLVGKDREIACKNILESAGNLARIHLLNEMVLEDLEILSKKDLAEGEKEALIATVVRFVHNLREEIPPNVYERWDVFQKRLTGSNFHDMLVRYIAMDLIIDRLDESGNIVEKIENKIQELADYGLSNLAELKAELRWLMSNDFYRARSFFAELGKKDKEKLLYFDLIQIAKELKSKRTPAGFLGSYLQDSYVQDKDAWINLIRTFAEDDDLVYVVPMVVWHSRELTDDVVKLLINLARAGKINPAEFILFEYGNFLNNVSPNIVEEWFDFLLSQNDITLTLIAISTHHHLYVYDKQNTAMPEKLTLRLLTHPTLFTPSEKVRYDQMGVYNWTGIAERFIEQHPARALEVSKVVLEHFDVDNTLFGRIFSEIHNIVAKVALLYPEQVWMQITEYLNPPYDGRAYGITHWLRGEQETFGAEVKSGPITIFPIELIWHWVEEDISQRSWYLATFVPPILRSEEEKTCWARELLVKYGDLKEVRNSLHANFGSGSWSGSASQYFNRKKENAVGFRKDETNPNVLKWLDEYIEWLERDIQRENIREERDDY